MLSVYVMGRGVSVCEMGRGVCVSVYVCFVRV